MKTTKPQIGSERFQWTAGAWFGSLLGCTLFMLLGASVFFPKSPLVASGWLLCYVVSVAFGVYAWSQRGFLRPYVAWQLMLLVVGLTTSIAVSMLIGLRPDLLADVDSTPMQAMLSLLVIPALMLTLHFLERR